MKTERTNRDVFRETRSLICEWEPEKDRPARLGDRYHGLATVEVGKKEPKYRVCADCAERPILRSRVGFRKLVTP